MLPGSKGSIANTIEWAHKVDGLSRRAANVSIVREVHPGILQERV